MPRRVPPGPYIDVCRRGLHVRIWEPMYVLMPRQKFIPVFDEAWDPVMMRILKGKVKFPKEFEKDAKSLVKHLLVADVT